MRQSIARNLLAQRKSQLREMFLRTRATASAKFNADPQRQAAWSARVREVLCRYAPTVVGFYWPLSGEFDLRDVIAAWLSLDTRHAAALPVIPTLHQSLAFHDWTPETVMKAGHHRIPEPTATPALIPDLLLVPCVAFDDEGYRLGYGGGYYDRTLAAWPGATPPITVGVAYEACKTTMLPRQTHDVPLQAVVTDAGVYLMGSGAASRT